MCVEALVWDLSGDLVRPDWVFDGPLAKAQEGAHEGEWDGDEEPQRQQLHQGQERHGSRRPLVPQHQVHDEKVHEHDAAREKIFQLLP